MPGNLTISSNFKTLAEAFGKAPEAVERAAYQAINRMTRDYRVEAARQIASQLAFPPGYTSDRSRLDVSKPAQRGSLEGRIRARGRPTSLARFVTGETPSSVIVRVKRGTAIRLTRAFLIRLRAGNADIETKNNRGLAIRLRPGERLRNKLFQVRVDRGLYLLYGPSVQQAFLDNAGHGVAEDMSPALLRDMEREFLRLLRI